MISKYLVVVVVICLAGLLKSEEPGPDFNKGRMVPSDDVCPWYWRIECPRRVTTWNGQRYSVYNAEGTKQCYAYKKCRFVDDCCDRKRKCQQDYNWHKFTVKAPLQPISVWVNVPATCCCLPYLRPIPNGGCTTKACLESLA